MTEKKGWSQDWSWATKPGLGCQPPNSLSEEKENPITCSQTLLSDIYLFNSETQRVLVRAHLCYVKFSSFLTFQALLRFSMTVSVTWLYLFFHR